MTDARSRLMTLTERRGTNLSALSRMLGTNVAYLQQYVRRGTPRVLPDRHRATLAAFFGVGEEELGGAAAPAAVLLPRLDVFASAGPGALVDTETLIGTEAIDPALARTLDLIGAAAFFGTIVTAEDTEHGKPDPAPFLLAASRLGVAAGRCLVFEDGDPGIQAARAAGMEVVDVRQGRPGKTLERGGR